MHYVSLIVEFLRGRPAVVFWTAALSQAALWVILPSLFYSTPPGELPLVLAVGHEFRLGSHLGPPLAFWLAEIAFRIGGMFGVYLLAQICVVVAYWSVFALGRATVGTRHAVLAVLLMAGVAAFSVPTPEFGPAVLAMPLWGLALFHYWLAVGEEKRGYWFLLGLDLGLLLLSSYVGLVLCALLVLFTLTTMRGLRAFRHIEPWLAVVLLAVVVFPHAAWLGRVATFTVNEFIFSGRQQLGLPTVAWLAGVLLLTHAGLLLMVTLASGWRLRRNERAPEIERHPVARYARWFIYYFALAPLAAGLVVVTAADRLGLFERIGPVVLLSGLAIVVAAGDSVRVYRERAVSSAWLGLVTIPPLLVLVGIVALPWTLGYDVQVGRPASAMGQFFGDNYQRRTGRPLSYVAGDTQLATMVALTAPSRPTVFFEGRPDRSPWATAADLRANGGILVWPATDGAGTPPQSIRTAFPEIVPEVPRIFARPVQGLLPLMRVGWAVIRPQGATPSAAR